MPPVALGLALVLIVVSESTANKKYLGTFPKSADKVVIHARLSFEPLLEIRGHWKLHLVTVFRRPPPDATQGGDYRGVYGLRSENRIWFKTWFEPETVRSLVTYKCSKGKCRATGSTINYQIKQDKVKGVWNFYFYSDPKTTENWVSVHGKRPQDVVIVFHWLYRLPVPEFSFAPLYVNSVTHFPFGRSEEVLIECPLYVSHRRLRPKVTVYDNGVAKCSYGKRGPTECEAYKGSSCNIFMIAYRVKWTDDPNSPVHQILCTSEASDETYYMSHFVQFP
nr:unnamed protein product [Spirometra erinaceieuropaei]